MQNICTLNICDVYLTVTKLDTQGFEGEIENDSL